jgi:radical SAM superfamily enzyme YgiQ (UPF0313 family)
MNVLLVWPKSRNNVLGWGDLGAVAEPLALEYLGAALQGAGHTVRILDMRLHPDALEETLSDFAPGLVGVTAYSLHVRNALGVCATVKRLLPTCATIAGGHHATFLPDDFFEPSMDYVVSGEGTAAIVEVANALARGVSPDAAPGLWLRRDGEFVKTLPSVTIGNDVDAMPLPARELTAHDRSRYFIDWMKPVALVRTTLGCPYRCSFCSIWKAMDGRYAMRKIDDVVAELATIEEEWVFLIDDEAFINRARMLELAAALERAGVRKRFFTYCRIDTLLKHTDAIVAWQRIGLERLFIGIDAVSPKDLDEYHKRTDLAQIEEGLRLADRLGISIFAQFVVNTDYTARDFVRLQRWVEHNRVAYPSFTVLTPLPGTELLPNFDNVVERQPNGRPNWDLFDCQNAVVPTALPKDEFRAHYRGLYSIFKGAYLPYREHNYLIDEDAIVARSFV